MRLESPRCRRHPAWAEDRSAALKSPPRPLSDSSPQGGRGGRGRSWSPAAADATRTFSSCGSGRWWAFCAGRSAAAPGAASRRERGTSGTVKGGGEERPGWPGTPCSWPISSRSYTCPRWSPGERRSTSRRPGRRGPPSAAASCCWTARMSKWICLWVSWSLSGVLTAAPRVYTSLSTENVLQDRVLVQIRLCQSVAKGAQWGPSGDHRLVYGGPCKKLKGHCDWIWFTSLINKQKIPKSHCFNISNTFSLSYVTE